MKIGVMISIWRFFIGTTSSTLHDKGHTMRHSRIHFLLASIVLIATSTAYADFIKITKASGGRNLQDVLNRTDPDVEVQEIFLDGEPLFAAVGFDLDDENLIGNRLQQALFDLIDNNANIGPFAAVLKALTPDELIDRLDPFSKISETDGIPPEIFLVALFDVYLEDPFISYRYVLPNPTDETYFYVLESGQEFFPLASKGDVQYETAIEVVDHDGDGASATVDQFFASRDASGGIALPFGVNLAVDETSPTASVADLLTNVDLAFGVPTVGQVFTTTVSVSPGDTAIIDGFFALGDGVHPLPSAALLADVREVLLDTNNFVFELLLAVPEPSSSALLLVCGLAILGKRRWHCSCSIR